MCENIDQSKLKLCKVWEIRNLTGPTLRMNEKIDQNLGKDRNEKKKVWWASPPTYGPKTLSIGRICGRRGAKHWRQCKKYQGMEFMYLDLLGLGITSSIF